MDKRKLLLLVFLILQTASTEPPGHLKKLGSHQSADDLVEVLDEVPSPQIFYTRYVKPGKPVIFRNAAKTMKAFNWTDEYLRSNYGDLEMEVEEGKKENRSLGVRNMKLSEFLDVYNTSDIYLVESLKPEMRDDFEVPQCLLCGGFTSLLQDVVMWLSSGGTNSVLHYDSVDNINCVIAGHKQLVLIDKTHYRHVDIDRPQGSYSTVDVDSVDMFKFPGLQDVPWFQALVNAGDCLYIPYRWFHQVRSSEGRNLAVNIWFVHLWKFKGEDCEGYTRAAESKPISRFEFSDSNEQLRGEILYHFQDRLFLSLEEFLTTFNRHLPLSDHASIQKAFHTLDKNSDSILTIDEVYVFPAHQLAWLFPGFDQSPDHQEGQAHDEL